MGGEILKVDNLRQQKNFVPLPYRRVSYQPYQGEMSEAAIRQHLFGREIYRRTDVIILHNDHQQFAVVAVQRLESNDLFTRAEALEVLALPENCVFIHSPNTDPANRSALAQLAIGHGVTAEKTLIVQGEFDHINLIYRPEPLTIRVIEVSPPEPPKLFKMAQHVLSYADLPPICLQLECIDIQSLCSQPPPDAYLVPCRSGGLDGLGAPVFFLDERPAERQPWTLIGCERSLQFHRHYYQDEPPRIEMCPRRLAAPSPLPTLVKCCLFEFDSEYADNTVTVPWGAGLRMIEKALAWLAREVDYA